MVPGSPAPEMERTLPRAPPRRKAWIVIRPFVIASLLVLLSLAAGFFSLVLQLNPFWGAGPWLPLLAAGSGAAFAVAGWALSGEGPPRSFALLGLGLSAGAAALAGIVLSAI